MKENKNESSTKPKGKIFSFIADSFHWSGIDYSQASNSVAAMLGLSIPLLLGVITAHPEIGAISSLGALALSSEGKDRTFREQLSGILYALAAGAASAFIGTIISGHGVLTGILLAVIAAIAGLFGSLSRPLARTTTQFILFTIIAAYLGKIGANPFAFTIIFSTGAVWTASILLLLKPVFKIFTPPSLSHINENIPLPPKYTIKQYIRRWKNSLRSFSGWQYTVKLFLCLAAATVMVWMYPDHHAYWTALTVVIVLQRNPEAVLKRTFQRSAGTILGVIISGLLLIWHPPVWFVLAMIAIFATARPVLREANYTAYATVMTPLVIILLDFGTSSTLRIMTDRLLATLAGSFIVLTLGYILWKKLLTPISSTKE
jgi:uncharacterized membrane protein YccC